MEKVETSIMWLFRVYRCYLGRMEREMDTIVYWGNIRVIWQGEINGRQGCRA